MKHISTFIFALFVLGTIFFYGCNNKPAEPVETPKPSYGGYESQVKWGEHLVAICGCEDCHTPKIMTDHGPVFDTTRTLSGHRAELPAPDVNRQESEKKGFITTNDLTAWVGPWGISYTANLTSDPTGLGNWEESNFMTAIKLGKFKGIESGRTLLPPMPWDIYGKSLKDDELKAIFAYLKSTKPIKNIVPEAAPPVLAMK